MLGLRGCTTTNNNSACASGCAAAPPPALTSGSFASDPHGSGQGGLPSARYDTCALPQDSITTGARGEVGGIQLHGTRQTSRISGSDEHLRRGDPLRLACDSRHQQRQPQPQPPPAQDPLAIRPPPHASPLVPQRRVGCRRPPRSQRGPGTGWPLGDVGRSAPGYASSGAGAAPHLALVTSCTTTSTMWSRSGTRPGTEVTLAGG